MTQNVEGQQLPEKIYVFIMHITWDIKENDEHGFFFCPFFSELSLFISRTYVERCIRRSFSRETFEFILLRKQNWDEEIKHDISFLSLKNR